ncbi:acetylornithine deacetylase/succinyl-diaminopimelate desuccinylase-like protein [Psychromicrobium silvestre]|uniref:Acetylornithine deacetylase/succinyl-diaminopimelate desuccinylase-like protein n=1 Tax=Psychromicrobium silvestre TaxID=1645614 RepID=A0A7Y9LRQ8_9MICC|nr:dipeptidase [Psychromicrobium silvestre]NYE94397.1 acetylornithine deacetylase/succinyl-diaminopimelate desuccinylase-like protein [Psychromicrobium silvestre]
MTSTPFSDHLSAAQGVEPDGDTIEALRTAVHTDFPQTVEQLIELAKIPGIAWAAFDPQQLDRSAEAVAELINQLGLDDIQILRLNKSDGTPGGPAVVARKIAAPGNPTILLYAHHDVQPPGEEALWNSSPFIPVEKDGRLWGRGVADDKAGVMAHIASLRAVAKVLGDDFGLGVTLFIEGEEEAGSPTFHDFLNTYQDLLRADVIVVADSGNWKVGVPALTTSLRGLVDGSIEVRVLEHAVHSGMFGGPVLDAPTQLARLISTFHHDDGSVAIEGLHIAEEPSIDYPEADFRADASLLDGLALAGSGSISGRLWSKPALSIIGIDAPAVAVSSNTIQPSATAKFSLRLAPGQDPSAAMDAVARHIEKHSPKTAQVVFTPGEQGNAFATDTSASAAQAMLWALGTSWGVTPVESGMGGSIPFIADLTELFPAAQILITGVEDPDSRAHSANESLHLAEFEKAVLAEALLLSTLNLK